MELITQLSSAGHLRACALDAGVGPLILVSARYSTADLSVCRPTGIPANRPPARGRSALAAPPGVAAPRRRKSS